jgi:F-type H+-transporting ATPase subunit b
MPIALTNLPLAAEESGGNFLVTPNVGLMLWTLLAFGVTLFVLKKLAFPRIAEALDIRQRAIEDAIDHAEKSKAEADQILADYRARLKEARVQADEIVSKAKANADAEAASGLAKAKEEREIQLENAKRDIEQATQKALGDLRREVADLTVSATEKITRRSLTGDDQQRLLDEALGELDFTSLGGSKN